MPQETNTYTSPLVARNASPEMAELFGAQKKFSTWRRLWLELAKAEKKLGLNIKQNQIGQMARHLDDINFEKAAAYEKQFRHDVMAHIYAFGQVAPKAAPIIHLGATSCYVGDNADLIIMREGLRLLAGKLAGIGFKVWPSEANYIFVRPPDGNADVLFQYLRRRGILVRHFNKPGIKDKLRISIGTPEEIEVLLGEIRQFLERRC